MANLKPHTYEVNFTHMNCTWISHGFHMIFFYPRFIGNTQAFGCRNFIPSLEPYVKLTNTVLLILILQDILTFEIEF